MNSPHAITKLTLENFRNYRALLLELPAKPVILTGHNGAGKTNILEALSLLCPGRGLRKSTLKQMDNQATGGAPWVVAVEVQSRDESYRIGMGRDGESQRDKRILKIDGELVRGHAVLTQVTNVQWLTPAMDQVFMEGNTARRKFLDRMVYGFDPEHATRVAQYELAMRERNKLLSDRALADPYWLSVLEQQMAEAGIAMTIARQETLARIAQAMQELNPKFPKAITELQGTLEAWLSGGISALDAEAKFAARLAEIRGLDSAAGRAMEGAHRSHFHVIHSLKNARAEQCSTGEQKALLLSLVLSAAQARAQWCGLPPILLLDEVIAHLDVDKRNCLFDVISSTAIQAWMTGTDAADFQGLQAFATVVEIAAGEALIKVQ
jgi:DNA replication and repair protein RecF